MELKTASMTQMSRTAVSIITREKIIIEIYYFNV